MEAVYTALRFDQALQLAGMIDSIVPLNAPLDLKEIEELPETLANNPPPISVAAFYGALKCIELLIDQGAELTVLDALTQSMSPLFYAALSENPASFLTLLRHVPADTGVIDYLLEQNDTQRLHAVLKQQLPQNVLDHGVETAIHMGNSELVRCFLDQGAQIQESVAQEFDEFLVEAGLKPPAHRSPFHNACFSGDFEKAKALLDGGDIDVNVPDPNGETPLFLAAHRGSLPIIDLLLKCPGIDVNKASKGGRTPIYQAADRANTKAVQLLLTHPEVDLAIRTVSFLLRLSLYSQQWRSFR